MTLETEQADAEPDDHLLIRQVARGEPGACDAFVQRYQERVARLAARLLGWGDEVEDAVQEVFMAAVAAAHRFRADAEVSTWLTRITVNKCRTLLRRRLLRLDRLVRVWQRGVASKPAAEPADGPAVGSERRERLRGAVADLPARDREVIVLRYLEQMDVAEVGRVLGLRRGAVEVRLHRARERLRLLLPDMAEDD